MGKQQCKSPNKVLLHTLRRSLCRGFLWLPLLVVTAWPGVTGYSCWSSRDIIFPGAAVFSLLSARQHREDGDKGKEKKDGAQVLEEMPEGTGMKTDAPPVQSCWKPFMVSWWWQHKFHENILQSPRLVLTKTCRRYWTNVTRCFGDLSPMDLKMSLRGNSRDSNSTDCHI